MDENIDEDIALCNRALDGIKEIKKTKISWEDKVSKIHGEFILWSSDSDCLVGLGSVILLNTTPYVRIEELTPE